MKVVITQKDFDQMMCNIKEMHAKRMQDYLAEQTANKERNAQLHRDAQLEVQEYEELKKQIASSYEIAPASHDTKTRQAIYAMHRHFKHEVERFCEGNAYLSAEESEVSFTDGADSVCFTIVVPKISK